MSLLELIGLGRKTVDAQERPCTQGHFAALPPMTRVYAIGDVHGRLDLLEQVEEAIAADLAARPIADPVLVHLGDYIDRGPNSRGVIERLTRPSRLACRSVYLCGNHDAWFRALLKGKSADRHWLDHGGIATLQSYGIALNGDLSAKAREADLQQQVNRFVPASHRRFVKQLELSFALGDYFFCHAGVRPGVPLDRQADDDLLWIRETFLGSEVDFGRVIVHGHTITEGPVVRRNRIGIDTGAVRTGRLTCLILEDDEQRFLTTG